MADPTLDEVNAITHFALYPKVVQDNFFLNAPFTARLRARCMTPFPGGSDMRFTFLYAPMIGGFYAPGQSFNITKPQTYTSATFQPKFVETNVTEYLEQILVINRGPNSAFSQIEIDLKNAMNTISSIVAVAMNREGQSAARANFINGWSEAINDGVTFSWDGSTYPSYGGQLRNGAVGSALNSIPLWAGTAAGAAAPITYGILEQSYRDCCRGAEEPDLGVCNKALFSGILMRIQPQQRFAQERDPYFGASGFKINAATVLADEYFPSLRYGQNNAQLGNWLTSTIASGTGNAALSNFPASTTCTVGEVFCWFNTRKWTLYYAEHPLFGFGFTGFKTGWDHTRVAGQVLGMVNLQCQAPWANKQVLGLAA